MVSCRLAGVVAEKAGRVMDNGVVILLIVENWRAENQDRAGVETPKSALATAGTIAFGGML